MHMIWYVYGFMKKAIDEFSQEDVITIPGL